MSIRKDTTDKNCDILLDDARTLAETDSASASDAAADEQRGATALADETASQPAVSSATHIQAPETTPTQVNLYQKSHPIRARKPVQRYGLE